MKREQYTVIYIPIGKPLILVNFERDIMNESKRFPVQTVFYWYKNTIEEKQNIRKTIPFMFHVVISKLIFIK